MNGKITIRNVRKYNRVKGSFSLVFVTFDIDKKTKGKGWIKIISGFYLYLCYALCRPKTLFGYFVIGFFFIVLMHEITFQVFLLHVWKHLTNVVACLSNFLSTCTFICQHAHSYVYIIVDILPLNVHLYVCL